MDLEAVRVFVRVAELGSFTRASEQLGLSKARASIRVKELEAELGCRLFHRSTRAVRLTEDGEQFLARATRLVQDAEELAAMFQAPSNLRGRVRIDLPIHMAREHVFPRLPAFLAAHPQLELLVSTSDRRVDVLREGFDCVVRVGALADSGLVARRLGVLSMVNLASPSYLGKFGVPKTLEDLDRHVLVHYSQALGNDPPAFEYHDGDDDHAHPMRSAVTVNGTDAYRAACLAGLGIIQAPRLGARPALAAGELVQILPDFVCAPLPVSLVQGNAPRARKPVRAVMNWLAQVLAPVLGCASFFTTLAFTETARAEPKGLELAWSAPEGCPTEREVVAAVGELAGNREAARSRPLRAEIRVEKTAGGFRLELGWRAGTVSAVRTLEGATCVEVAQAAAVIIALAADPATDLEELRATTEQSPPPPPPLAVPPAPAKRPPPAARPAAPTAPPDRIPVEHRTGVRAGVLLDFGSLPRAAPGAFAGGEVPIPPFSVVAEALAFVPMDEVTSEGAGRFLLSALSLKPCYRALATRFTVSPCAAVEAHAMFGRGERLDFRENRWAFYGRLGVGAEGSYRVSSRLELVASGFVLMAPSRPTFVVGTGTLVHEPAAASGRLGLGLELRL